MQTRVLTGSGVVFLVLVLAAAVVHPAPAGAGGRDGGWVEEAKLTIADTRLEALGESVALDGDTLVAATTGFELNTGDSGSVFVYRRTANGWVETAELRASDGEYAEWFGATTAIEGGTIVVAAPHDGLWPDDPLVNSGAVYVFNRNTEGWIETKLTASDAASGDAFGSSDLDGDTIAALGGGTLYVFTRSGSDWMETATLTPSDAEGGSSLGGAVAIEGDSIVATGSGSVYVFTRTSSGWVETAKLSAQDGTSLSRVAFGGDTIAASGFSESVHVFTRSRSGWVETASLSASDGEDGDGFGRSLAIDGDRLVVGASGADGKTTDTGAAYVFQRIRGRWVETDKLSASDGDASDRFGWSVALDGDTVAVGAYFDDATFDTSGSVYVFSR